MNIPVEKLTEAVPSLSSDARALLVDRLVESLDPLIDDDVRASWVKESMHRLDEVRSGKLKTIPADQVIIRVRDQLK
jgi:Putative addiction module component